MKTVDGSGWHFVSSICCDISLTFKVEKMYISASSVLQTPCAAVELNLYFLQEDPLESWIGHWVQHPNCTLIHWMLSIEYLLPCLHVLVTKTVLLLDLTRKIYIGSFRIPSAGFIRNLVLLDCLFSISVSSRNVIT